MRIRRKEGQYRELPIPADLATALAEWFTFLEGVKGVRLRKKRGVLFAASPLVFPGKSGEPVTNSAFNARLRAACQETGVRTITAHALRHTAATLLLNERGAHLRDVQALLGHRSLATTARYTRVDQERSRNVVGKLKLTA